MKLKDAPIRRKLMVIILFISGVVSSVTCAALFGYEFFAFRQGALQQLSTLGRIVADNSTAALAFENQDDARAILTALKAEPHVVAAALYSEQGGLFCKYPDSLPDDAFPKTPKSGGYAFMEAHLAGFQPVLEGNRRLGTLYLKS